jgi:hypothetical protein
MVSLSKTLRLILSLLLVISFVIFYPMFISIYVWLPLFIGMAGYFLMQGIEKGRIGYILFPVVYFINLEANLSLPLFLTIIATLLVYQLIYSKLHYFKQCYLCRVLLSTVSLDILYLLLLLSYDFIFQTSSIGLDMILLYSLSVDFLLAVFL